jgi:protein-tyrosine-phosphatase
MMMFGKKLDKKLRILFLDRKNDYVSQVAEHFANEMYSNTYEVYSAGFEHDIIDCDLISVMYQNGEDMRRQIAKDLKDEDNLPKDGNYDYVIYLEQPIFDEYSKKSPWQGHQIVAPMKLRKDFTATDDAELYDEYVEVINQVREWVKENLKDPENLSKLVSA